MFTEEISDAVIIRERLMISLAICVTAWLLSITVISSVYASTIPLSQTSTPLYYRHIVLIPTLTYFYLAAVCYERAVNETSEDEEWRMWGFLIAGCFSVWYHISASLACGRLEKKFISEWREGNVWRSVLLSTSMGFGIFAYLG